MPHSERAGGIEMTVFSEHKVVTACMIACLVMSLFFKVFLGMLYARMIKEADNMATTDNKLLKQCKIKFSNCYELNNGISNIPVFVDKFINRLSFGVLSFELMYHLSGQLMLLSVVFSGLGICKSIMEGRTLGAILPFYIFSFIGLYLFFSISTVVDIKTKKRVLRVNLVDYLENHLSPRIDVTRQDMERLYGGEGKVDMLRSGGRLEGRRAGGRRRTVELLPIGSRLPRASETVNAEFADLTETGGAPEREQWEDLMKREAPAEAPENSAAVTEEELEALLKEFLIG